MTDLDKRASIIAKIRALLAKTTQAGATEPEAMAAMEMAGRFMEQYRITLSDVEIRAEPIKQETVSSPNSSRRSAADRCLWGIMHYAGVKCWSSGSRYQHRAATFFGLEADVAFAVYLYGMINHAVGSASREFKKSSTYCNANDKRNATTSFVIGMTSRINKRLTELTRQGQDVTTTSGTALVVVRNAVVEAAFNKLDLKLRSSRSYQTRVGSGAAYRAGDAAGEHVRFDRPLADGAQRTALR